ncbi:hypothetical protein K503DRAFT_863296 [Rhizopogon vinicolor AM-OR11-026]|uniref:Uncharacterized protein n=1 Tax=Rhizopogon vinicolor AM-OR11-026 TaxID=1314800 RepID=A0A1B7NBG1_9AGAM|nr:hypothetical protein K503DRAFT_863296 [Rhizopogon vinicolor AM-OR11-026]
MNPDLSVFLKHANPSPLAREVVDPSYRHGTELQADDLSFSGPHERFIEYIQDHLANTMFEDTDWHRDVHRASVLLAFHTYWEGYRDVQARDDMQSASNKPKPTLVVFYTDTEYKFIVIKGVQLVHQYDIEVIEEQPPNLTPLLYDTLENAAQSARDLELSRTTYVNPDNILIQAVAHDWRGFYFILHGRVRLVGFWYKNPRSGTRRVKGGIMVQGCL